MQFNDTTNNSGIVQQARFMTKASSSDLTTEDITRLSNMALDRYTDISIAANLRWDIDDSTYSTHSVGRKALVSGQSDYSLPTTLIQLKKVFVQNSGSTLRTQLKPIDEMDSTTPLEERFKTDGSPEYYDIKGGSIFIYPAPNYSESSGLVIEYTRVKNYFVKTDTTKVAGIPNHHIHYIPLFVAEQDALSRGLENYVALKKQRMEMEEEIGNYWANLGIDDNPRIGVYRLTGK